jgi:hypothetical protein
MRSGGSSIPRIAVAAGVALVVACLLAAQLHVAMHARSAAADCKGCLSSVYTAPVGVELLHAPAHSVALEILVAVQETAHGDIRLTAPRAPPLA